MAYINGDQLNIFPVSNRSSKSFDNWLTEFNLSSIINQLVGNQTGFVITEKVTANTPIEFNIGGYYFKVNPASSIKGAVDQNTNSGSSFVTFEKDERGYYTASIKISKNADNPILLGSDDSTEVSGGSFNTKTLRLFKSDYQVPFESRLSLIVLQNLTAQKLDVNGDVTIKGKLNAKAKEAIWATNASNIDDGNLDDLNT